MAAPCGGHPAISGLVDAEPLAWFEAERTSLVAAVHQAAGGGLDELAWDLAGCLARFFAVLRCLAVDRALGDRLGEALTLQSLGELQRQQDRRDLAQATLEQALAALREVGYPTARRWPSGRSASCT